MCKEKNKPCFICVDCEIFECKKYKTCEREDKSMQIDFNAKFKEDK